MSEQDKINAFVVDIIDHFFFNDCRDIDGGDFQGIALAHGVIEAHNPTAPCCADCQCLTDYDDDDFEAGKVECNQSATFLDQFRKLLDDERVAEVLK
jgi:hypothetical protein